MYTERNSHIKFIREALLALSISFAPWNLIAQPLPHLIPYRDAGSKWGYADSSGNIIVPCIYALADLPENGYGFVKDIETDRGGNIVREDGKVFDLYKVAAILREEAEDDVQQPPLSPAYKDLIPFKDMFQGFWGYYDSQGKVAINPEYRDAQWLYEGRAAVRNKEGKWGYIDRKGTLVINYKYSNPSQFRHGLAIVNCGEGNSSCMFLDTNGVEYPLPQYDKLSHFGYRTFIARTANKQSIIIGPAGKPVRNFSLSSFTRTAEGNFIAESNGRYGILDTSGGFTLPYMYNDLRETSHPLILFAPKAGLIRLKPTPELIAPVENFDQVYPDPRLRPLNKSTEGLFFYKPETKSWTLISPEGQVLETIYQIEKPAPFYHGKAAIGINSGKDDIQEFVLINNRGEILLNKHYRDLVNFGPDTWLYTDKKGRSGFINSKGKKVRSPFGIPGEYLKKEISVEYDPNTGLYLFRFLNFKMQSGENYKLGYADKYGRVYFEWQ